MLKFSCWNVRGLNAQVKSLIHEDGISLCAILETHIKDTSIHEICSFTFGRWGWISNAMHCSRGTRMIIAWDFSVMDVVLVDSHEQYMRCLVRLRNTGVSFYLTIVYGANMGVDRRNLWFELAQSKGANGR